MKRTLTLTMAMLTVATVRVPVTLNIQLVSALRECGGCVQFKKLTHEYEKNVINAIGDPNQSPEPRELLVGYVGDVNRIFIGDSNID